MNHRIRTFSIIVLIILFLSGCEKQSIAPDLVSISGPTMGTSYTIKFVGDNSFSSEKLNEIKLSVDSVLTKVNRQMSTYIDTSEISKFNKYEGTDWFEISSDFAFVLSESKRIGLETNGALDITIGPLVNLWGFGPQNKPRIIPEDSEILEMKKNIGLNKIMIRLSPPAVKKEIPAIYLDLSATAKGFGVDKVFELINAMGYENYFVEIGGEVRAAGRNHKNEFWKIGVANPSHPTEPQAALTIDNAAVATSGDYWNYFEENGVRYSHTIDARTGRPITHKLASVTVVSESCIEADALATAINVMGPEEGYKFAVENNFAVYLIVRDKDKFSTKITQEFKNILDTKIE